MELSTKLNPRLIHYPLNAHTKEEVIAQLINLLVENGQLPEAEEARSAVFKREEMMSTGVGKGVALPHGKYAHIEDVLISFGISKEGIDFGAIDDQPVYIFVLLLTPQKYPSKHLQLLSKFSKMLNIDACRKELMEADSASEILEILIRFEKTL